MSRYQVDFEFRDAEEELTPLGTVSISVGREFYEGMVNSKIVRFAGHLFCYEDNTPESAPDHALRCVRMVEARPALPSAFDASMRAYDDYAPPAFCAALKDTTDAEWSGGARPRGAAMIAMDGSFLTELADAIEAKDAAIERLVAERDESDRAASAMSSDLFRMADERDKLKEALKPFADAAESIDDTVPDRAEMWEAPAAMETTAGDFRRARQALGDT